MLRAVGRETTEDHLRHAARTCRDLGSNSSYRDARGKIGRAAVDAGRNSGVGDRSQVVDGGEVQCGAITARQHAFFVFAASAPNRTNGMDHVSGLESVTLRDLGGTGFAAAESAAFTQKLRPCGAVDG